MNTELKKIELYKRLEGQTDYSQILTIAREIIGNPMIMVDTAYNLMAQTPNTVKDDPLWNELESLGRFSHESVDFFNTEGFIESYAATSTLFLMKSSKLKYDRVGCVLYGDDGVQTGSLCIVSCEKPFEEGDFELIEALGEFLKGRMHQQMIEQRREEEKIIFKLLQQQQLEPTELAQLKAIEIDGKKQIHVVAVDVLRYEKTLTHLEYFCDLFKRLDPRFRYYTYLNNVIILINCEQTVYNIKKELSTLCQFFSKHEIFAGVSGEFFDILQLKKYFLQAINSLNYGVEVATRAPIYYYDDYRLKFSLIEVDDITDICHPIALNIYKYDKQHKTSYLRTLRSFFKDSLLGRQPCIDKELISSLFGLDFGDERMLFTVYGSLNYIVFFKEKVDSYLESVKRY